MCVCVYMYMCVHVYIYVCIHIYMHTYIYMYMHTYTYAHNICKLCCIIVIYQVHLSGVRFVLDNIIRLFISFIWRNEKTKGKNVSLID